jgi:hypothetical protein
MLRQNGIYDVKVTSAEGFLSGHYNPEKKTVNLSPEVYNGTSVCVAAVAAHECRHVIQHATQYRPSFSGAKWYRPCSLALCSQLDFTGWYGYIGGNQKPHYFAYWYY